MSYSDTLLQVLCCRDSVWTAAPSFQGDHLPVSIFETIIKIEFKAPISNVTPS